MPYIPKAGRKPAVPPLCLTYVMIRSCSSPMAALWSGMMMTKSSPPMYPAIPLYAASISFRWQPILDRSRSPSSCPYHSLNSLKCSISTAARQYVPVLPERNSCARFRNTVLLNTPVMGSNSASFVSSAFLISSSWDFCSLISCIKHMTVSSSPEPRLRGTTTWDTQV